MGKVVLTEVRFRETRQADTGRFGTEEQQVIRVVTQTEFATFVKVDRDWRLDPDETGTHSFGGVPMATCVFNEQDTVLESEPTLLDLAWANLEHWQSSSDQRNILRFARCGMYFAKGFKDEELNHIAIGPNQLVAARDHNAEFSVVEYSGSSIEAGRKDLEAIEERMVRLGVQPLLNGSTARATATQSSIDEGRSTTQVQQFVHIFENFLEEAYRMAAQWLGQELPDDFSINVFDDFAVSARAAKDIEALLVSRRDKNITRETFLREVKRRGLLSDDVDVEDEIEKLEEEAPDFSGLPGLPPSEDDENEEEEEEED